MFKLMSLCLDSNPKTSSLHSWGMFAVAKQRTSGTEKRRHRYAYRLSTTPDFNRF